MAKLVDSFEGEHIPYQGHSELTCPEGWSPTWHGARPEIKPKRKTLGEPEVYDLDQAVSIHTRHIRHDAILKRRFDVVPGPVTIKVWCMNILPDDQRKAGHGLVLGISDRDIGHDFESEDVYWSDWWSQDMKAWVSRQWQQLKVSMLAQTGHVWVYLRSKSRFDHNAHAHFDLFELDGAIGPDKPDVPPEDNKLDQIIVLLKEIRDWIVVIDSQLPA